MKNKVRPYPNITPIESIVQAGKTPKQQDIDARISAALLLWYYQNPELDRHPLSIKATAELIACLRVAFAAPKGSI